MEDTGPGTQPKTRVTSVDALRGLVMIIMALDHTREFFHSGAMTFQPDDLTRATTVLFFTRWVTHICAPVFMFTAGLGAFLWMRRGRTAGQLSHFLWKRGLWLVVLELTVLRLALDFSYSTGFVLLTILWALGWSMVALGFLVRVPIRPLAVFSIAVHRLAQSCGSARCLGGVLRAPTRSGLDRGDVRRLLFRTHRRAGPATAPLVDRALGLTLAFLVIRGINIYGDPVRWSTQIPGMTVLSFLTVSLVARFPPHDPRSRLASDGIPGPHPALEDQLSYSAVLTPVYSSSICSSFTDLPFPSSSSLRPCRLALNLLGPAPAGWYGYPLWVVYAVGLPSSRCSIRCVLGFPVQTQFLRDCGSRPPLDLSDHSTVTRMRIGYTKPHGKEEVLPI